MLAILTILKYIITLSDLFLCACIGYFTQGLRWSIEKDRSSIIGFGWMLITITASVIFLWI